MPVLCLCGHQLEMITQAVAAFKPARGEEEDHNLLMNYLLGRTSEQAIWDEISPEDIPF